MKRTLFIFLLVLVSVYVSLSYVSLKGEHNMERKLWRLRVRYQEALTDPKAVPDAVFHEIIANARELIATFPDSRMVPAIHILIGRVHTQMKDFEKAREEYEKIIVRYPQKAELASRAIFEIIKVDSIAGEGERILAGYNRLIADFPTTSLGINAPILKAYFLAEKGNPDETLAAFRQALNHYNALIGGYPQTKVAFDAMRSKSVCHMALKEWEKAVKSLSDLLLQFPRSQYWTRQTLSRVCQTINTVSMVHLKDHDVAIRIYQTFVNKNPEHPFNQQFRAFISELNKLKSQNIRLVPKAAGNP